MGSLLLRPRWIAATLVAVALIALFVELGFWQLRRHEERELESTIRSTRLAEEPIPMETALAAAGPDVESLEYRRVIVEGRFVPSEEVLVRGQAHQGRPGFHVVTPFRYAEGESVLVNRGWVPLELDRPPVHPDALPPGRTEIAGIVRLGQERRGLGPAEPPGRLEVVARIDIDRLDEQVEGSLTPFWLQLTDGSGEDELPVPLAEPGFADDGPHLEYAMQWFAFAVIGAVGFVALALRASRQEGAGRR